MITNHKRAEYSNYKNSIKLVNRFKSSFKRGPSITALPQWVAGLAARKSWSGRPMSTTGHQLKYHWFKK